MKVLAYMSPSTRKTRSSPRPKGKTASRAKTLTPEVLPPSEADETSDEAAESRDSIDEPEEDHALVPAQPHAPLERLDSDESSIAVSRNEPLKRYLQEISRIPLLDPMEEIRLVQRMRDEGDANAAKLLVQANLRLVVKIAFEYRSVYANILDLIQEGNVGLMKAVSKFDPTKGAKLSYYSSWWIRSYILKYLLDNFRLVRVGTTQAQKKLFFHLMREKEKLEAQGLLAGPKLLADRLQVKEHEVIEMEQRLSGRGAEVSIDAPLSHGDDSEGGATHGDFLMDSQEAIDTKLAREQLLALLRQQLPEFESTLNQKERDLLRERLLAEEPKTLQEVADLYGLTRERARQIETKVIEKLRAFLKPSMR